MFRVIRKNIIFAKNISMKENTRILDDPGIFINIIAGVA